MKSDILIHQVTSGLHIKCWRKMPDMNFSFSVFIPIGNDIFAALIYLN